MTCSGSLHILLVNETGQRLNGIVQSTDLKLLSLLIFASNEE